MELIRDMEREAYNQFRTHGHHIDVIMSIPHQLIQDYDLWLRDEPNASHKRRDRWQYARGLCMQVLRARGEDV